MESWIAFLAEAQSNQQATLIYDNIDCLEETCSRSGASHRLNRIGIQRVFIGPLSQVNRVKIEKSRKQSLETPADKIYVYKASLKTDATQSI